MRKLLLPLVFFTLILAFIFGSTLFPAAGKIIYGSDLGDQFYFWKSYYVESIKNGAIPFWNPYSFSGTPFLAHPSVAPFYLPNLIFFILPLPLAFSAFLYLHLVLAGIGMYWYVRNKTDTISSLITATIFSLSGFFAVRIYAGHVDIISTAAWTPLVFGSIVAAVDHFTKRNFLLAVIFLSLQLLAGYQAAVVFTLELIGLFLIFRIIFRIKDSSRPRRYVGARTIMTRFLTIVVLSYGLSAIQLLPTIEFVKWSIRSAGLSYGASTWGSYNLDTFRLFLFPFIYGSPFWDKYSYKGPGPNYLELAYFAGVIPVILFILYLMAQIINIIKRKKTDEIFFSFFFSLIILAVISLGKNFPLHKILYDLIPPYRLFRFPAQHLMTAVFILAAITGIVVSKIKTLWLKLLILLIIIIELASYDRKFIKLIELPTTNFDTKLIKFLQEENFPSRVLPHYNVTAPVRSLWDFESTSYYKIPITSGYNPLILYNYYHFIELMNKTPVSSLPTFNVEIPLPNLMSKLIDFLNIKYVLTDVYGNLEEYQSGKYKLVLSSDRYKLYENLTYQQRFFLVKNAQIYASQREVEEKIKADNIDFSQTILFTRNDLNNFASSGLTCPVDKIGNVDILNYAPSSIILQINANCNSMLSTSEVYYPGWRAKLDGQVVKLYLSNSAFRSIYVPKGIHKIEFYYQPTIYYIGGIISVFTVVLLVGYFSLGLRNQSSRT